MEVSGDRGALGPHQGEEAQRKHPRLSTLLDCRGLPWRPVHCSSRFARVSRDESSPLLFLALSKLRKCKSLQWPLGKIQLSRERRSSALEDHDSALLTEQVVCFLMCICLFMYLLYPSSFPGENLASLVRNWKVYEGENVAVYSHL